LTVDEKESCFDEVWRKHADIVRIKFDRKKTSEETYKQLCELYENELKCSGEKIKVSINSALPLNENLSLREYSTKAV
jgi:hypothetical protein